VPSNSFGLVDNRDRFQSSLTGRDTYPRALTDHSDKMKSPIPYLYRKTVAIGG